MFGLGKKQQTTQPGGQTPPVVNGQAVAQAAQPTPMPAQDQKKVKKGQKPQPDKHLEELRKGSVSIVDIIAPSSVEVDFRHIRVGDKFYRTFFVVDYPRQVSPNWLSILIDHKETMNISMFLYPVESKDVLSNLRRKIAEMEATLQSDAQNGIVADPKIQASLEDAVALREELARGLERFFQFGLYVTISADTLEELNLKTKELTSLLASNLLVVKPATLQMEDGFKTTLPAGNDKLMITRNMDTTSVASTFPFTSYEISHPNGILYGINTLNNSLVIVDRFSLENANEVVFGKSGSGKSFLIKLELMRQYIFDTEIIIIDPEDEYKALCQSLNGEYITFSKNSEVKINPFALLTDDMSENQLSLKILSIHGLLKTMLGEMTATQEAIMDRAIVLAYKQKGITPNPATYKNEPPILEDLYKTLLNMEEADAKELAFRLEKYVKGGFSGLFNQQTNYDVQNKLTVFSLRQLEDVLRPIAMHVILDFVWARVRTKLKKRILVVDEAWYLMRYPDSAAFLQGIAKRARKYYLGVTTLTQDIEDFLGSDYGKSILSNSSIQILLKQGSSEVETLAKTLNLSGGEKQYLLTAQVGEGLLFAGQNHVTAQFISSQFEYDLITSKPQDILDQQAEDDKNSPPPPPIEPEPTAPDDGQALAQPQETNGTPEAAQPTVQAPTAVASTTEINLNQQQGQLQTKPPANPVNTFANNTTPIAQNFGQSSQTIPKPFPQMQTQTPAQQLNPRQ